MIVKSSAEAGFSLILSLIVVTVVLSTGLVILDLTIKQVQLAATTRDSEIAFHATNAGVECGQMVVGSVADFTDTKRSNPPSEFTVNCFGGTATVDSEAIVIPGLSPGLSTTTFYDYEFTWGPADARRCSRIGKFVISVDPNHGDVTMSEASIADKIAGYQEGNYTCSSGGGCVILSARGYNEACPAPGGSFGYGVVERKVLLQF